MTEDTCGSCGYGTPFSRASRLYLCVITGKMKRARDPCDAPQAVMNQWSRG